MTVHQATHCAQILSNRPFTWKQFSSDVTFRVGSSHAVIKRIMSYWCVPGCQSYICRDPDKLLSFHLFLFNQQLKRLRSHSQNRKTAPLLHPSDAQNTLQRLYEMQKAFNELQCKTHPWQYLMYKVTALAVQYILISAPKAFLPEAFLTRG